MVSRRQI